jgi:putative FmdB family regulatory protein
VPIYEFTCQECRHLFDVMGNYSARTAVQVCPSCESRNTRAVFSTFASLTASGDSAAGEVSTGGCGGCGGGCACSSNN